MEYVKVRGSLEDLNNYVNLYQKFSSFCGKSIEDERKRFMDNELERYKRESVIAVKGSKVVKEQESYAKHGVVFGRGGARRGVVEEPKADVRASTKKALGAVKYRKHGVILPRGATQVQEEVSEPVKSVKRGVVLSRGATQVQEEETNTVTYVERGVILSRGKAKVQEEVPVVKSSVERVVKVEYVDHGRILKSGKDEGVKEPEVVEEEPWGSDDEESEEESWGTAEEEEPWGTDEEKPEEVSWGDESEEESEEESWGDEEAEIQTSSNQNKEINNQKSEISDYNTESSNQNSELVQQKSERQLHRDRRRFGTPEEVNQRSEPQFRDRMRFHSPADYFARRESQEVSQEVEVRKPPQDVTKPNVSSEKELVKPKGQPYKPVLKVTSEEKQVSYASVRDFVKKNQGSSKEDVLKHFSANDIKKALLSSKIVERKGKLYTV